MTQTAEAPPEHAGSLSLALTAEYAYGVEDPNRDLQAIEEGLARRYRRHYESFNMPTGNDVMLYPTADQLFDTRDETLIQGLQLILAARYEGDPLDIQQLKVVHETLKAEGFVLAAVDSMVNSILTDSVPEPFTPENKSQISTQVAIKEDLLHIDVRVRGIDYAAARDSYNGVLDIIWGGRQTAIRNRRYDQAAKIGMLGRWLKPEIEHSTLDAATVAADIVDKLEADISFNLNDLARVSEDITSQVVPGAKRYAETADKHIRGLIGSSLARQLQVLTLAERELERGDEEAARKHMMMADTYHSVLKELRVQVEVVGQLANIDTPADALGTEYVEAVRSEEGFYDVKNPTDYDLVSVDEVAPDPVTNKPNYRVVVKAGMAVVGALSVFAAGYMNDSGDETNKAQDGSIYTFVTPEQAAQAGTVTDTPEGSVTTDEASDVEMVLPDIDKPAEDGPTAEEQQASAEAARAIGSIPLVNQVSGVSTHEVQADNGKKQAMLEELDNVDYNVKDFDQAYELYKQIWLEAHPAAEPTEDAQLTTMAAQLAIVGHAELVEARKAGTVSDADYRKAHRAFLEARLAGEFKGLLSHMDAAEYHPDEFKQTLIDNDLMQLEGFSTTTDVATRDGLLHMFANSYALSYTQAEQQQYVQTFADPGGNPEPGDGQEGEAQPGGGHEGEPGGQPGGGEEGQPGGGEEDGGGHEQEHGHETKSNLSKEQNETFDEIAGYGPVWQERVRMARGLMEAGLRPEVAFGFVGNASVEGVETSGGQIIWSINQNGGPAIGAIQWEGSRKDQLIVFATERGMDWTDPRAQIGFIIHELEGTEGAAAEKLRNAQTAAEAGEIIARYYERPAAESLAATLDERIQYSVESFQKYQDVLQTKQHGNDNGNGNQDNGGNDDNGGHEDDVPDDPEARASYLAEELHIPKEAVNNSTSYSGIFHFTVDTNVGTAMLDIPVNGGYPAHLDQPPLDALVDSWGMYSRECVSYVAWRVSNDKHPGEMPHWGGVDNQPGNPGYQGGNAEFWEGNGRADGYRVDDQPAVGAAVTWTTNGAEHQFAGHVAYVEKVMKDGSVVISQYNNGGTGTFSIEILTPQYLQHTDNQVAFVHFEDKHGNARSIAETAVAALTPALTNVPYDPNQSQNGHGNSDEHKDDHGNDHPDDSEDSTVLEASGEDPGSIDIDEEIAEALPDSGNGYGHIGSDSDVDTSDIEQQPADPTTTDQPVQPAVDQPAET